MPSQTIITTARAVRLCWKLASFYTR